VPEGLVESIAELRLLLKELATKSQQVDKLTPWARAVLDSLPASIQAQMKLAPEESSGSAQVNNIETERLLAELVGEEMQRRKAEAGSRYNKSFAPVCFYLGYQARSSLPTPFDCALGTTLGYTAGLLIKEGLTGYAATVSEVCKPQAKWSVGGVPLCAFARPTPEGKVVIQPNLVDLNGETFREFSEQRQQWEIMDSFINPGPIQYDMMTRPKTGIADIASWVPFGSRSCRCATRSRRPAAWEQTRITCTPPKKACHPCSACSRSCPSMTSSQRRRSSRNPS